MAWIDPKTGLWTDRPPLGFVKDTPPGWEVERLLRKNGLRFVPSEDNDAYEVAVKVAEGKEDGYVPSVKERIVLWENMAKRNMELLHGNETYHKVKPYTFKERTKTGLWEYGTVWSHRYLHWWHAAADIMIRAHIRWYDGIDEKYSSFDWRSAPRRVRRAFERMRYGRRDWKVLTFKLRM